MKHRPALIIEPDELEALLGSEDLLIVDVCQMQNWQRAHIPGAVHVNPGELVCGLPPAPGKMPDLEQLQTMFARIGYQPEQHIVVYDDEGGGWAGRFIWTLDMIGHQHYSYLNGGLIAWYHEEHPLTAEIATTQASSVTLALHPEFRATLEQVKAALKEPDTRIWDARSAEEYAGLKASSARAGHIPGAVNLDWLDLMDRNRNLRLLPLPELRLKLDAIGIVPGQRIITHCQSHHRSGLTYLAAKALGFTVLGYDGSWAEWGNLPDTPIEMMA